MTPTKTLPSTPLQPIGFDKKPKLKPYILYPLRLSIPLTWNKVTVVNKYIQ
jgi:hypothetical protein